VSDALVANPADDRDLEVWADSAGASSRTLARLFVKETGLTFGAWRQRLRLLAAISRLGAGQPVTAVSYETGYHSPSAFIAMFKRTLGMPPGQYFRSPPIPPSDES
jgi:AraC-like DNA-binding protein